MTFSFPVRRGPKEVRGSKGEILPATSSKEEMSSTRERGLTFNCRRQEEGEAVHVLIMDLHRLAEHCGFGELRDELIRDRIVVGLRDSRLSEKLQLQADLMLESAVTAAIQTEQVKKQQASLKGELVGDGKQKQVDAVEKEKSQGKRHRKRGQHSKPPSTCTRCGRSPLHNKSECPAKDEQCHQCGKRGHFKRMCRNPPRVNTIQQEAFLGEVKAKKDSQWMVELLLNGSPVSFKVDTGADMTVVPEKTFKSIKGSELRPAETALYGPNRQRIPSLGQATMVLQKGDKEIKEKVFVVPQADQALLGKPAIEALGLLQRIDVVNEEDDVTVIKQRYPKLFQGLGKLAGKYKIRLKEDAKPIALSAPRRIAVPLLPKVKKELQRMESLEAEIMADLAWFSALLILFCSSPGILRQPQHLTRERETFGYLFCPGTPYGSH